MRIFARQKQWEKFLAFDTFQDRKKLYLFIFICNMLAIAHQTAEPNGPTFFEGTLEYPGLKRIEFFRRNEHPFIK